MRVLIVEDEVRLAQTLQDLMEMEGYTADVCHDGEAGLDNALSGIYDVILLDVMLPKLDGFTVLRRLRSAGSAVPVLMLTARDQVGDKVTGLDAGADYYLTKPFEPRELTACVRALTRRQPELRNTDALTCGDIRLENPASEDLGLRIRRRGQQRGGVHLLPAQEAGAPPLLRENPHHPHGGLLPGGGRFLIFHVFHGFFHVFHRVFDIRKDFPP